MAITLRQNKGSALTFEELDANFEAIAPRTSPTGQIQIPTGTTSERDSTLSQGQLRYNTSISLLELYNGSSWLSVGTIATTATKWATARTITLGGDLTGNVSIDGSADVTLTATIAANSVALGTDTTGNYVATGAVSGNGLSGSASSESATFTVTSNATDANTADTIVFRNASGNFSAGTITASLSGNASTATTWATARTITLGGDLTGNVSIDGSADVTLTATIAANSVALGTDTTGNYVATITGTANEIEVSGSGSENASITIGLPNDVTIGNNLTVTGNLTVNGSTTTVASTNTTIKDTLIELNNGAATNSNDIGILMQRGSTGNNAFMGWDESEDKFIIGTTTATGASSGNLSITTGTLVVATLEGNVIGNASTATTWATARTITLGGDLTGNVSIDGSADVTLTATVAANSVALGTDTTGNYVASITNGSYITGGDGGSESAGLTLGVDATDTNTASKIVARDASGNFSAGTITASLSGNASTATKWATARTITLGGVLSGNVSIDGSADVTLTASHTSDPVITLTGDVTGSGTMTDLGSVSITTTVAANSVELGTDTTGNYVSSITNGLYITGGNGGSEGAALTLAVDATDTNTASKVVVRDASGNFSAGTITASLSGNASTATKWATARTITLGGDLTGNVSIDGSADVTLTATVAANSVALGTDTTGNYVATIAGTTNEIEVSGSGSENASITIGLPNDVTIGNNLIVTGSLTTNGNVIGPTNIGADNGISIGSNTNRYNTVWATTFNGTATEALYADLAEKYLSDDNYPVGTVMAIGGIKEITAATQFNSHSVIGVVSQNPAYKMNSALKDGIYIALKGRVLVRIEGSIKKGDRLSPGKNPGIAIANNDKNSWSFGIALTDAENSLVEAVIL